MIFHLVANSYALRGEVEFNTTVKVINYAPFVALLEIGVIAIPILFHAIYGMFIVAEMQGPGGNTPHYGYTRNWLYVFQRWSGVVAFAYLIFHTYDTSIMKRILEWQGASHEVAFASISYAAMAYRFTNMWYLAAYIIGITAAAFHLGNGIFNFSIRWGIAIGKQAQQVAAVLGWIIGLGLTLLGAWIAINFSVMGQSYLQKYPSGIQELIKGEAEKMSLKDTGAPKTGEGTFVAPSPANPVL
jgi:succinate dehydrogenase / fumarate reductase cytochrome b subunit